MLSGGGDDFKSSKSFHTNTHTHLRRLCCCAQRKITDCTTHTYSLLFSAFLCLLLLRCTILHTFTLHTNAHYFTCFFFFDNCWLRARSLLVVVRGGYRWVGRVVYFLLLEYKMVSRCYCLPVRQTGGGVCSCDVDAVLGTHTHTVGWVVMRNTHCCCRFVQLYWPCPNLRLQHTKTGFEGNKWGGRSKGEKRGRRRGGGNDKFAPRGAPLVGVRMVELVLGQPELRADHDCTATCQISKEKGGKRRRRTV